MQLSSFCIYRHKYFYLYITSLIIVCFIYAGYVGNRIGMYALEADSYWPKIGIILFPYFVLVLQTAWWLLERQGVKDTTTQQHIFRKIERLVYLPLLVLGIVAVYVTYTHIMVIIIMLGITIWIGFILSREIHFDCFGGQYPAL